MCNHIILSHKTSLENYAVQVSCTFWADQINLDRYAKKLLLTQCYYNYSSSNKNNATTTGFGGLTFGQSV